MTAPATGYVRIYRSLFGHVAFRDMGEAGAFAWMIASACWQDYRARYKDRVFDLKRGQLVVSMRDFAAKMGAGWSEARARRFLDRLTSEGMVVAAPTQGGMVVTICNYDEYQADGTTRDAPPDALATHERRTIDAVATQDRRTTDAQNKEGKELKKEDNRDSPHSPPPPADVELEAEDFTLTTEWPEDEPAAKAEPDFDRLFEEWWAQYPRGRKGSKPKCRAKYESIIRKGEATAEELLRGAMRYAAAGYDDSKFVAGPLPWLNQGRWADEDVPPPSDKPNYRPASLDKPMTTAEYLDALIAGSKDTKIRVRTEQ